MRNVLRRSVFACLMIAGCGDAGPKTYPISGKVTLDGQPLKEGDIIFSLVDGSAGPGSGKVVDGAYSFQAPPGAGTVAIRASRANAHGKKGAFGEPLMEDYIPDKYNTQTTLKADVGAGDKNVFDFDLKSKP